MYSQQIDDQFIQSIRQSLEAMYDALAEEIEKEHEA